MPISTSLLGALCSGAQSTVFIVSIAKPATPSAVVPDARGPPVE